MMNQKVLSLNDLRISEKLLELRLKRQVRSWLMRRRVVIKTAAE